MNYSTLKKGWVGAAMSILFINTIVAQIRTPFEELNLDAVDSDFFYPQTFKDVPVPSTENYDDPIDYENAVKLFSYFDYACLDEESYIGNITDFHSAMQQTAIDENVIPIAILDIRYHDFAPNSVAEGLIYCLNNKFYNSSDQSESPYIEKSALVTWIGAETIRDQHCRFKVCDQFYVTNRSSMTTILSIDFDDGLGFRDVQFNEIIEINYSNITEDREIKISLDHNNTAPFKSAFTLKSEVYFNPCASTLFPFPNAAPWPTDPNPFSEWQISTAYASDIVKGNAFTLTSSDGLFDKPFIFVEGVDFGGDNNLLPIHHNYQNGTFGWCQFTSGFLDPNPDDDMEYGYDMLHLMPEFLAQIRSEGYDIVLLDFWDGADYLEKNSALLQHTIRLCNEYKFGQEPLVVAGASMGGLISRHALRSMELNNEEHCTRLWISLDAPHAGANIPAALQQAIKFGVQTGSDDAINFKNQFLLRPAAKQMLNYQACNDMVEHDAWFSQLNAMGYPQQCRTLAITNGLGNGAGLNPPHPRLLDWECDILGFGPKQFLYHNAGNPWVTSGPNLLLAEFRTVVTGFEPNGNDWLAYLGLSPVTAAIVDFVDQESEIVYTVNGQYNWDYAPGGTRSSIKSYVDAINNTLEDSSVDLVCNDVASDEFNKNHCFISTLSAVGQYGLDPYMDINSLYNDHPEYMNFDRIEFAELQNEKHTEITPHNMQIILEEVLGNENSGLGSSLSSASLNSGVFNYGKPNNTWLRDLEIHHNGHLYINRQLPTHFNQEGDYMNNLENFAVTTESCSPAIINVTTNGSIEIGDPSGNKKGTLILNRDSKLIIGYGGKLRIYPGSQLIINEGAELIVHPNSLVFVQSGSIVVNEGGLIIIQASSSPLVSTNITLLNSDAVLRFNKGQIKLENNAFFAIKHDEGESGYVEVMPSSNDVLINGVNSFFTLTGDGSNDKLLVLNDNAIFKNSNINLGKISLKNCLVDMTNEGKIQVNIPFNCDGVNFKDFDTDNFYSTGASVMVINSSIQVNISNFTDVRLINVHGKMHVLNSSFTNPTSGIKSEGGGYTIKLCHFEHCAIKSLALETVSYVEECSFQYAEESNIEDESLVDLRVKKCQFINDEHDAGILKRGGKLSILCNDFATYYGVTMWDSELNASATSNAGYNDFYNSTIPLNFIDAISANIYKGYNNFSGEHPYYASGTMNAACSSELNCEVVFDGYHNYWGHSRKNDIQHPNSDLTQPNADDFNITTSVAWACSGYESSNNCNIRFIDDSPVAATLCPELMKPQVKSLIQSDSDQFDSSSPIVHATLKDLTQDPNTPEINTSSFQHVPLDSALVYAAMRMLMYDSLGNDIEAINLFHEILLDSLDQANPVVKHKMNWGRYNMKTALENLFLNGDLTKENNQLNFQPAVQNYVDVLNYMTDTLLTDSTYRLQFYLELDKGQLFRTIGKPEITQEIFSHLDECSLDSLEQNVLNNWRQQIDYELSALHQYVNLNIPIDSINTEVDTTNYTTPMNISISDYYFGLFIDSPNSVTFVSCGEDPVYRNALVSQGKYTIFPNPCQSQIQVIGLDSEEQYSFELLDFAGQVVYRTRFIANGNRHTLDLPEQISNGLYILRMRSSLYIEDNKLAVFKN